MKAIEPLYTIELFPGVSRALHELLHELSPDEWDAPTACAGWSVRDVAAHLLGGNLGRLAAQREQLLQREAEGERWQALFALMAHTSRTVAPFTTFNELVAVINRFNAEWIEVAKTLATSELVDYLALTDPQLYELLKARPAHELARFGVAWAGEAQSANWFDIAREYTEKWHHQQHIRDAVQRPALKERRWFFPVLDAFMRALPYAYRNQHAAEGAVVNFYITGAAGGEWSLRREKAGWRLYAGSAENAAATASLDQELAWRLFTNGVSKEAARQQLALAGDQALGAEILNMVSIMA